MDDRRLLPAVLALVFTLPAHAQESMPVYVSAQFKDVAQKAFRRLATDEVKNACPPGPNAALCEAVATQLSEAFAAALRNDQGALTAALTGFFSESAQAALVQLAFGGLLAQERTAEERTGVGAIVRCVLATISGRTARAECKIELTALQPLLRLRSGPDCVAQPDGPWCRVQAAAQTGQRASAADLLRVSADIASSHQVNDVRARVMLLQLAALAEHGIDDGLTDAAIAYLQDAEAPLTLDLAGGASSLIDYQPGSDDWSLYLTKFDEPELKTALATCGIDRKPFDDFVASRDDLTRPLIASYRRTYLQLGVPQLGALEAMLAAPCTAAPDSPAAKRVALLRNQVKYLEGPLVVASQVQRLAVPALLAAALLDFIRSRESATLERGLRKALVFGAAQTAALALTLEQMKGETPGTPRVTTANHLTVKKALASCEARKLAALLGVTLVTDLPEATTCSSLFASTKGKIPQLSGSVPSGTELASQGVELRAAFDALFSGATSAEGKARVMAKLDAGALSAALVALSQGQVTQANRLMLRQGVDFIVDVLDERVSALVGGEQQRCASAERVSSIFKVTDGACALHLLFKSAYQPIADYFWQGGFEEKTAKQLAASTYTTMLTMPGIDRSPIILNLGLGATYIYGDSDIFGPKGYAALTLLDKVGIAFVKFHGEKNRFEFGPFVGGFLDALVRSLAQEGKAQRSWLAGLTAGFTRIANREFGVEVHVAAAMPFEISQSKGYGFAAGLALVVPFTLLFSGD